MGRISLEAVAFAGGGGGDFAPSIYLKKSGDIFLFSQLGVRMGSFDRH